MCFLAQNVVLMIRQRQKVENKVRIKVPMKLTCNQEYCSASVPHGARICSRLGPFLVPSFTHKRMMAISCYMRRVRSPPAHCVSSHHMDVAMDTTTFADRCRE